MTSYWCEQAWLNDAVADRVRVSLDNEGTIQHVEAGVEPARGDEALAGMVLPGFANAHSHAFHRALRGRTHASDSAGTGRAESTFWLWRERMYELAARLDPDAYLRLATATYAEMARAGYSCVGEFHYLHHDADGTPYDPPNAMADVLREAARRAGIRLTLIDACYLTGGIGEPLTGVQRRFGDGDADGWAARVDDLALDPNTRIGVAAHSVRAVPADQLATVAHAARDRPLHMHLSEQPGENTACLSHYGRSPTTLLAEHGLLGPSSTAVHATHLRPDDVRVLGESGTTACFCPTTERDLGDGIGPASALAEAGSPLALGSDQHAVIDPFEDARAVEMNERLASGQRGRFSPAQLVTAATAAGHASLGWPEAGRIRVGAPCDLVGISTHTVRTAGATAEQVMFAATAADIHTVVVNGRPVVAQGCHVLGDVGRLLTEAIEPLWGELR